MKCLKETNSETENRIVSPGTGGRGGWGVVSIGIKFHLCKMN